MVESGTWDGSTFKLREFVAVPGGGSIKNVEYTQTMGRITLKYCLRGPASDLTAKELVVELSCWELKVQVDGSQELTEELSALSGDLWGDVRRDLSWWTLEKVEATTVITIELAKKEHKAWNGIWKAGMNPRRKQHFGWNSKMPAPVKKADEVLVKLKPGRRLSPDRDPFVMNRESLCVGLEDGQDSTSAIFRIHLHEAALEKACEKVCLASLFGVDVMDRFIKIFIRGDERSPICMGELGGPCIPDRTTWEIVKVPALVDPQQRTDKAHAPAYSLALVVKLAKKMDSKNRWPKLIIENEHALLRDAAPDSLEEMLKIMRPRTPSPDRSAWSPAEYAKENKAKGDAAFKSASFRDAIVYYTRAIGHTPQDEKLYSNRSVCYVKLKKFEQALEDAHTCISLNQAWPKAYFRQGQALRGLRRWEDAKIAFTEGRFRDPHNSDWDREVERTSAEQERYEGECARERRVRREADMTTELNEATTVAERDAMTTMAQEALKAGKNPQEAGEIAVKAAEIAKGRVHEMAAGKKRAMMVEDDKEPDEPAPYRIVCEDGSVHAKGFAHTDKGMYFMGMTMMNYNSAPSNQPWIEIHHPGKMRWSQGCAQLKMKIPLPASVQSASEIDVRVSTNHIRIGTKGNADPIVEGDFERKVEPDGENFAWYIVPDETPPVLELIIDKDSSEVWQTFSYGTLLWPRLFKDDLLLGEGLFEADLTDLPPVLRERFQKEQARSSAQSRDERERRKRMTEEEVSEEMARNWNDEFARHGIPHRLATEEDKLNDKLRYV